MVEICMAHFSKSFHLKEALDCLLFFLYNCIIILSSPRSFSLLGALKEDRNDGEKHEHVRIHFLSNPENVRICTSQNPSKPENVTIFQNWKVSKPENVRIGLLQNIALLENARLCTCQNPSKPENVRFLLSLKISESFKNRKMSDSF